MSVFEKNPAAREEHEQFLKRECDRILQEQVQAMENACSSGEKLAEYLEGRGRLGSALSSGNAAIVLAHCPNATIVRTDVHWDSLGARRSLGAKGIKILSKEHNKLVPKMVYDKSDTYGSGPERARNISASEEQMLIAVNQMEKLVMVPVIEDEAQDNIEYDTERRVVLLNSCAPTQELLKRLPSVIVKACFLPDVDLSMQEIELYGLAVSAEVCGRLGLKSDTAKELDKYIPLIEKGKERKFLNNIRDMAKSIGDNVEAELSGRTAQRNKRHGNAERE